MTLASGVKRVASEAGRAPMRMRVGHPAGPENGRGEYPNTGLIIIRIARRRGYETLTSSLDIPRAI